MKTNLINIGNSKGIIIPIDFLKILELEDKVDIQMEDGRLTIAPQQNHPRQNWAEAIKQELDANPNQERLIPDFFEDELHEEWEW